MSDSSADVSLPPLSTQIQQVLSALMAGSEAKNIKPGHYIVLVDGNVVPWTTLGILQELQKELATADIHLHLVPIEAPNALTFIEVAPALAQFAAEQPEARG